MADIVNEDKSDIDMTAGTDEELRKELNNLQDEFSKLQHQLTDIELKYQSSVKSSKSNVYGINLISFISNLFNQPQYSDTMIILRGGTQLYGHKLILASQNDNWGVSDFLHQVQLDLTAIDNDIAYHMIKWVYTGSIDKEKDDLFLAELFKEAKRFNLESLNNSIQDVLMERVNQSNYKRYHQLSVNLSADLLWSHCTNMASNQVPNPSVESDNTMVAPNNKIKNENVDSNENNDGNENGTANENNGINDDNDDNYNDDDDNVKDDDFIEDEYYIDNSNNNVDNDDDDNDDDDDDDDDNDEDYDIKEMTKVKKKLKGNLQKNAAKNRSKTKAQRLSKGNKKSSVKGKSKTPKEFNAAKYIGNSLNCHFCCVEYPDEASLEQHVRQHANQINPFSCNKCDTKDISTRKELLRHLGTHETKKCRFCEQVFDNMDELKAHKNAEHPKDQRYRCLACGKGYARKTPYVIHLRVHSGERPYTCEVCGKAFNERGSLKVHSRIHTGVKPFICDVCGKAYYSSTLLNKHLRLHSPNGAHSFVCTTCGHKFTQKCHLQTHELIHKGVKPHQCNYCGKMFTDKSSFNRHNKTHTGERPHVCSLCGKAFIQRVQLIKHNISHEKQRLSFQMKYETGVNGFSTTGISSSTNLQPLEFQPQKTNDLLQPQ